MASPHACPAYGSAELERATKIESVEVCLLYMLPNINCLDSKLKLQAQTGAQTASTETKQSKAVYGRAAFRQGRVSRPGIFKG